MSFDMLKAVKLTTFVMTILGAVFSNPSHAESKFASSLDGPEIFAIELKAQMNSKMSSMIELTNSSTHDIFYHGNPPENVKTRLQFRSHPDQIWTELPLQKSRIKFGRRILKSGEALQLTKPKELSEAGQSQFRMGLYVSWNPNEKVLSLNSKTGAQPTEDGWVYFNLGKETDL